MKTFYVKVRLTDGDWDTWVYDETSLETVLELLSEEDDIDYMEIYERVGEERIKVW